MSALGSVWPRLVAGGVLLVGSCVVMAVRAGKLMTGGGTRDEPAVLALKEWDWWVRKKPPRLEWSTEAFGESLGFARRAADERKMREGYCPGLHENLEVTNDVLVPDPAQSS